MKYLCPISSDTQFPISQVMVCWKDRLKHDASILEFYVRFWHISPAILPIILWSPELRELYKKGQTLNENNTGRLVQKSICHEMHDFYNRQRLGWGF